jgi:hypothetical protein
MRKITPKIIPIKPVAKNKPRHPNVTIKKIRIGGEIAGPHLEAESQNPVAKSLSFFGNHSEVIFAPVGLVGASPIPRKTLAIINITNVPTVRRAGG